MTPATLFVHPLTISGLWSLLMVLPLCLAAAIVYKTIRTTDLRRLWREVLQIMGFITAGLVALSLGLWLLHTLWP